MLRRLIKLLLARKRGDNDHWRRLYERELRRWEKERRYLLSQIAITHGAAPMVENEKPHEPTGHLLTEEELIAQMETEEAARYAHSAAFDDFSYEVLQANAARDPIWAPVLEEAEKLRKESSVGPS